MLQPKALPPEGFKAHERPGEKIGGGWFIVRRGRWGGRIKFPDRPFEHPSLESARKECDRLRKKHPDLVFQIFGLEGYSNVNG